MSAQFATRWSTCRTCGHTDWIGPLGINGQQLLLCRACGEYAILSDRYTGAKETQRQRDPWDGPPPLEPPLHHDDAISRRRTTTHFRRPSDNLP